MEPTLCETISAALITVLIVALLAIGCAYLFSEWWRTRRCSTKYEYAYHARQNNYEVKFITGGRK